MVIFSMKRTPSSHLIFFNFYMSFMGREKKDLQKKEK